MVISQSTVIGVPEARMAVVRGAANPSLVRAADAAAQLQSDMRTKEMLGPTR